MIGNVGSVYIYLKVCSYIDIYTYVQLLQWSWRPASVLETVEGETKHLRLQIVVAEAAIRYVMNTTLVTT